MAPLELEVQHPINNEWMKIREIRPHDRPGSISDNTPDGRQIYLFECKEDDSGSIIYRSRSGMDINLSEDTRSVENLGGLETVKELTKGESFEMSVKTDRSSDQRRIRFTHK